MNGCEAMAQIHESLGLTVDAGNLSEDCETLAECLRLGARGYLLNKFIRIILLRAIRSAYNGESIVAPQMMTKFVNRLADPEPRATTEMETTTLTRRDVKMLAWLARGVSNKEIARAMNLAESTVKVHVQVAYVS